MMLDGHPYLTRLNTFISPAEMNKDPFFFESRDPRRAERSTRRSFRTMCGDQKYMACNAPCG